MTIRLKIIEQYQIHLPIREKPTKDLAVVAWEYIQIVRLFFLSVLQFVHFVLTLEAVKNRPYKSVP